jgi:hypothetical protein
MRIKETKIQQKEDDNIICEKYYSETVQRQLDRRYVVRYPFKKDRTLSSSLPGARARFSHLEKKFSRDKKLKMQYEKFVEDLIENEHLIRLPEPLQHWVNQPANFLPHHWVYKKTDTKKEKIQVVFDAAAKTTNKNSLNDILVSGPVCQNP